MRLSGVSFQNWLRSHQQKDPDERWLRELYPWPVLAQIHCDEEHIGVEQLISFDGADYVGTLEWIRWQQSHNTFKYRIHIESDGLGWHSRSFDDTYDMCGGSDGSFVTLFHTRKKEPLERITRAFFASRWEDINASEFRSLAVSRFLAASLVSQVVSQVYSGSQVSHYPAATLHGNAPMFARGTKLWIGYRFFSENAYAWARNAAMQADRVIALYFADTKYQFKTELPTGSIVQSLAVLDANGLSGEHEELIRVLLRKLDLPNSSSLKGDLQAIVAGNEPSAHIGISDADVNESLVALKLPCQSKADLRYLLAAAVVVNAWIEQERKAGFIQRKKFYAFKQRVAELANWAKAECLDGVTIWTEPSPYGSEPVLFLRIHDVDFSFHAIPNAEEIGGMNMGAYRWSGVRLKPIAPLVLAWARELRALTNKQRSGIGQSDCRKNKEA